MPKSFLGFDADGTARKFSVAEKIVSGGIEARLFDADAFNEVERARGMWRRNNSEGTYTAYLKLLVDALVREIEGVEVERFDEMWASQVSLHSLRRFAFPLKLAEVLSDTHLPIIISGSPVHALVPMFEDFPVSPEHIYGSVYEVEDGHFTGRAKSVGSKREILQRLVAAGVVTQLGSAAVGDTMSDVSMFEYADHPVPFNPTRTLTDYARVFRWPRVMEVADQITVLQCRADDSTYAETTMGALIGEIRSTD